MKIYTKTGDGGETSLLGGARVPKDHLRVAAYGDVEEANAALGAVRGVADAALDALLLGIQKDLFAIGAQLADPGAGVADKSAKTAVTTDHVRALETAIDAREATLPKLRSFVLPAGAPTARLLHQARTVCRRAERSLVALAHTAEIDPSILAYLNRLSDLLFVLAREANQRAGVPETTW